MCIFAHPRWDDKDISLCLPTAPSLTFVDFLTACHVALARPAVRRVKHGPQPTPKDPILFMDYLVSLLPSDSFLREEGLGRWGCVVGLNLGLSYLAYRGLR